MARRKPEALYTIGYEGRTPADFIAVLQAHGVAQLIDVRRSARSHKAGFAKTRLAQSCAAAGIAYVHLPEVGVPRELRPDAKDPAAREAMLQTYARDMLPAAAPAVQRLAELSSEQTSALLCFEADARQCHRGPLSAAVARLTRLPVKHL